MSKTYADLQTMNKTAAKFQKDQTKTVEGVVLLSMYIWMDRWMDKPNIIVFFDILWEKKNHLTMKNISQ